MIPPSERLGGSVIEDDMDPTTNDADPSNHTTNTDDSASTEETKPFPTVLRMIEGALVGFIEYADFMRYTETTEVSTDADPPTLASVAKRIASQDKKLRMKSNTLHTR